MKLEYPIAEEDISYVCQYCGNFIRGKWPVDPQRTSHGICDDCLRKLYPEVAEEMGKGKKV